MKKRIIDIFLLLEIIATVALTVVLVRNKDLVLPATPIKENKEIVGIKNCDSLNLKTDLLLKGDKYYVIHLDKAESTSSNLHEGNIACQEGIISVSIGEPTDKGTLDFADTHYQEFKVSENECIRFLYKGEKIENLADCLFFYENNEMVLNDKLITDISNVKAYDNNTMVFGITVEEEAVDVFLTSETLNSEAEYNESLTTENGVEYKYNADAEVSGMKSYLYVVDNDVLRMTTANTKALDAFTKVPNENS